MHTLLGSSTYFLFDGWNLLADLNTLNNNAVVCTYTWGLDLSGSLQGAGGVGGLLLTQTEGGVLAPRVDAAAFDGNGNVIGLVDMATGTKSATYDYNAFGETIQSDGVAAAANHFRFSTKYTEDETGLLYYGLRYYSPSTGRWLSRDPIEERGGVGLYLLAGNDGVNGFDALGLRLSEYSSSDVNEVPVSSLSEVWAGAETKPNWPSGIVKVVGPDEDDNGTLEFSGKFSATINYVDKKVLYGPAKSDTRKYKILRDHEQQHADLSGEEWNLLVEYSRRLENKTWTCSCARWAKAIFEAKYAVAQWRADLKGVEFDIEEYGSSLHAAAYFVSAKSQAEAGLEESRKNLRALQVLVSTRTKCEIPD